MDPQLQMRPSRNEFEALASSWPMVPVWTELLADVSTPVGVFPAIAGNGPGLILESVERSERWGRYSFVAGDPAAVVVVDADGVRIEDVVRPLPVNLAPAGVEPREALIGIARSLAGPRPTDLPPLTGGLMGYLAYEAATLLDGHPAPEPADAPCPPIGLLVIDRAVVFDHWRQRLILVAHVPAGAYDEGVRSVRDLAARIASAQVPALAPSVPLNGPLVEGDANMPDEGYRWTVSAFKEHILAGDIYPRRAVSAGHVRRARGRLPHLSAAPRHEPGAVHVLRADARDGACGVVARTARARRGPARVGAPDRRDPAARGRPRSETGSWSTSCSPTRKSRPNTRCSWTSPATISDGYASPGSVHPTELMEVERFTKVMHIVSTVEGELREDLHPLDALAVTFPAGTVTGAPKRRAMELIAEHEPTARGPYAGAVGYLTFAGDLDFCITIRTAVIDGRPRVGADGRRRGRRLRPGDASCRRRRRRRPRCFPRLARGRYARRRAGKGGTRVILIVDHYDSFTYNLVQLIESLGRATEVVKSDAESAESTRRARARCGDPVPRPRSSRGRRRASRRLLAILPDVTPVLGVCLGHQALGLCVRGGRRPRERPCTARPRSVFHEGKGIFEGVTDPFEAGRYHSLVVLREDAPRRAGADGLDRGRAGDGGAASDASAVRRAVPPGVDPHARRARGSSRTSWRCPA